MKSKKTGHAKNLDQFYTNPEIAKKCISELLLVLKKKEKDLFFLEPSAGTGSFSNQLENCISVDLDPKIKNCVKSDFLVLKKDDVYPKTESKKICVIGNPPFGKNSSLAVKFFNHSCNFGDTIAFIIPKTFRKQSLHHKLNLNYWLLKDIDLPKNSFIYENKPYDVPCCFQVWIKKKKKRAITKITESPYLIFSNKKDCDFAVRRVGGRTGKAYKDYRDCAEVSHYFFKVKDFDIDNLIAIINSIDFSKEANSTAGVRSISKSEFLIKLHEKINK